MELFIPLEQASRKPLYEQIYTYICREIRSGSLQAGERLPSTRMLAEHLRVSRSTTQMAYDQLEAEGYIEARPCRGYFVCRIEGLVEVCCLESSGAKPESLADSGIQEDSGILVDFSPRGIDLESFPYNTWRKLSRSALTEDQKEMFLPGIHQGELDLREAIRSYLHGARGVNCSASQIIVGAGNEYLLMLLAQILGSSQKIAMENPTYKQAYRVFKSLGFDVCPIEMDENGMDPRTLKESGADVAYVMPSHQFPMGIVMPVGRRQELLKWAEGGRYLIEDDYDSEFRYRGKPIPALQSLDRTGRVIYFGTFSRCIAPAIRVSYMVLPLELLERYRRKAGFYASTVSRIDQNILCRFLSEGHFERHLNRMRAIYKAKHDALLEAAAPLEQQFSIGGEYAGIHILLTDRQGRKEEELVYQARQAGVKVYGLSGCHIGEGKELPSTLLLGYANVTLEQIRSGTELLLQAWK